MTSLSLTVAIPTYRREAVLVETLRSLLAIVDESDELMVIDQTEQHEDATEAALSQWQQAGRLKWIRMARPSITAAMNKALMDARGDVVLFLDDDIIPDSTLLEAHRRAHQACVDILVAGRVIQPWQEGIDFSNDSHFHFASSREAWINEFMGGNFSMRRQDALALRGFDLNFVRTAYRFEAEFAWRWIRAGKRIRYVPMALIHHLKVASGGTRTYGEHLTTARPDHSVGEYYFFLRTRHGLGLAKAAAGRLFSSVATRHHLRRPWWIPVSMLAEIRGLAWAVRMHRNGPRLLYPEKS